MGTAEAQHKYKQRSKCEWPNAQCRNHGLQQFLVRGLHKVKSVVLWYVLVHNLFRMAALRAQGGAPRAAKALGVSPSTIYRKLESWQGADQD